MLNAVSEQGVDGAQPGLGQLSCDVAVVISSADATRASWRERLARGGVSAVHECGTAGEAGLLLRSLVPDGVLVLVDAGADVPASSVAAPLADPARFDRLVVVGLPEPSEVQVGLTRGTRAYLFPPIRPTQLAGGESATSEESERMPAGELGGYPVTSADGVTRWLTYREAQILRFVADGLDNKEIGRLLGLSAYTVKSHLARASRRLRAQDRAHLLLLALRARVVM